MSTIYGNPLLLGGGGVKLNIDYGTNPPSDTTKLWVPRATAPSSVEAKYEFKFGNEQLAVDNYNYIPTQDVSMYDSYQIGDYIYHYIWGSNSNGYFQRYDMNSGTWEKLTTPTNSTGVTYPYVWKYGGLVVENKLYMFGGRQSSATYLGTVYEYDADTNTLTRAAATSNFSMALGTWIKAGDVAYGFACFTSGGYNRVAKYDFTTKEITDASGEFTFDTTRTVPTSREYYPFNAGNGVFYLLPLEHSLSSNSTTPLLKVDLGAKTVATYSTVGSLFPTLQWISGSTSYNLHSFNFKGAGIVQVGSTGYIFGGLCYYSGTRSSPYIFKIDISSNGLTVSNLDTYLFSTYTSNLFYRAAGLLDNKIHIVQYYSQTTDTSYRNNQTLTLYSPLDSNKLFLQTGFGNNKFNIVNDNKAKVEIAINNAFIGNSENKADETDAFLYNTDDSKWENIKTGNGFYALKGDLISMDLDGNGDKQYRVLNINGNNAECLAMYTANADQSFNKTSKTTAMGSLTVQQYSGSDLDTYLNTTWYNTLSNVAKTAIVSKFITQDAWLTAPNSDTTSYSPIYTGTKGESVPGETTYSIGKYTNAELAVGNRNVYALGVQDIIDYLSDESFRVDKTAILRNVNIWKMFYNIETQPVAGYRTFPWLRSADARNNSNALFLQDVNGGIQSLGRSNPKGAIPAFTIDLSKIPFTRV